MRRIFKRQGNQGEKFYYPLAFEYLILLILINCGTQREYTYNKFIVGGPCEIKFYYNNEKTAKEILGEIDRELMNSDSLLNYFSEKSLVSDLNRNLRTAAPQEIIQLFLLSDSISRLTNGLFDISVAPLLQLWGFYQKKLNIPQRREIGETKKLVDYQRIKIKNDSIIIQKGMQVDLGGIAQGFAADRVGLILKDYRVKSAIINIGGEILTIGYSPKKRPWSVGIKNPRGKGIIEQIKLQNQAVSTSGDYEKFFMINNKRYPHIINPKTGVPALNFVSVTIFSKEAAFADGVSTAVAVMGPKEGIKFLDSLGIRGIIYYEENGKLRRLENEG